MRRTILVSVALLLGACGSRAASNPEVSPPDDTLEPEESSGGAISIPEESDFGARMHEYLWRITDARDLVIAGELDAARSALRSLAEEPPPAGIEGEWRARIEAIRARASEGASASSASAVAAGVSEAALQCGTCHLEAGRGPGIEYAAAPDLDDSLRGEMHRHVWASDRAWEGLIAASSERWVVGVAAIFGDEALTAFTRGTADGTSWVGALDADTAGHAGAAERAAFYADFISACAACHTTLGVGPAGSEWYPTEQ